MLTRLVTRSLRCSTAVAFAAVGSVALVTAMSAPAATATASFVSHGGTVKIANDRPFFADTTSSNWSGYNLGYLSTNTLYSSISGTWVVPTATQHAKGQAEHGATWIGIGGGCLNTSCTETDSTLIQAGTEQDVSKAGKASYSAWYELIPATSTTENIAVHPGDTINCSISSTSSGEWTITLTDTTDGQHFTESTAYSSDETTAEWIVETPVVVGTGGSGLAALPNLGRVHFTKADVNGKAAALQAVDAMELIDSSNKPIATPSSPNKAGTAFYDCTWASTCSY
jgi:hypothetical protein